MLLSGCFAQVGKGVGSNLGEKPSAPTGWTFSNMSNENDITNNLNPKIMGSSLESENGSRVEIFESATCSMVKSSSVISSGAFIVKGINYARGGADDGSKSYWGRIVRTNGDSSDCVSLELNYTLRSTNTVNPVDSFGLNSVFSTSGNSFFGSGNLFNLYEANLTTGTMNETAGPSLGTGDPVQYTLALAEDNSGTNVYALRFLPIRLFSINKATGNRTTIAQAGLSLNTAHTKMIVNSINSFIYILQADKLVRVSLPGGTQSTVSEVGIGTGPVFTDAKFMAFNSSESEMFVVSKSEKTVSKITMANGNRSVVSNTSQGTGVNFETPISIAINSTNTLAYVVDTGLKSLIEVNLVNGNRRNVSPSATSYGIALDSSKDLKVVSGDLKVQNILSEGKVLEIDLATGKRNYLFNPSVGYGVKIEGGEDFFLTSDEKLIYVIDKFTDKIVKVDVATGSRESVASTYSFDEPFSITLNSSETLAYVYDRTGRNLVEVNISNGNSRVVSSWIIGTGTAVMPTNSESISYSKTDDSVYLAGAFSDMINVRVSDGYRVDVSSASRGTGTNLNGPKRLSLESTGAKAYLVDVLGDNLHEIDISTGNRTILSGGGQGTGPIFSSAFGLSVSPSGASSFIGDLIGHKILKIDNATGNRTLFADYSTGSGPDVFNIDRMRINASGSHIYILLGSGAIIKMDTITGNRTIISY